MVAASASPRSAGASVGRFRAREVVLGHEQPAEVEGAGRVATLDRRGGMPLPRRPNRRDSSMITPRFVAPDGCPCCVGAAERGLRLRRLVTFREHRGEVERAERVAAFVGAAVSRFGARRGHRAARESCQGSMRPRRGLVHRRAGRRPPLRPVAPVREQGPSRNAPPASPRSSARRYAASARETSPRCSSSIPRYAAAAGCPSSSARPKADSASKRWSRSSKHYAVIKRFESFVLFGGVGRLRCPGSDDRLGEYISPLAAPGRGARRR